KVVNAERIPGGPITLELKDVPEGEALDVLLRSLSGYIVAPRMTLGPADASLYDSIAVMPTVASAAARPAAGPSNVPPPFSPPPAAPTSSPGGLVGTSAPGMLPPAATQPGQIVPQPPPAR